jgi:hypothetical protein
MSITINLDNNKKAYMIFKNEQDSVPILINSKLFKELWRNTTCNAHFEVARGNEESWIEDYKYKWAELGFSYGKNNPVPLARINYEQNIYHEDIIKTKFFLFKVKIDTKESLIHSISFNDGITRTIWLLCNGAKKIPFSINIKEANELINIFKNDIELIKN